MRRTVLTIFALSLFMLIPVDALAQTTQGPTKIKGTATNGIGLEVTGPTQLDGPLSGTSASFSGNVVASTTLSNVPNVINAMASPYSAKGDGKQVLDAVTNSTSTVTSGTAAFTVRDVGKLVSIIYNQNFYAGTIVSYVSNTTVTVSPAISFTTNQVYPYMTTASMTYGTNDSSALQSAINAASCTDNQLYLPSGIYMVNAQLNATCALSMSGSASGGLATNAISNGSVIVSLVTGANYALSIGDGTQFWNGLNLKDFRITGGGVGTNGVYLNNVGSEGYITDVTLDRFTSTELKMNYGQDIVTNGLVLFRGGNIASTYCLDMGGLTNLIHLTNTRIEECPGSLHIDSATGIEFNGFHFENSQYAAGTAPNDNINYTQPPFVITSSLSVKFNGGLWGTVPVETLLTNNSCSSPGVNGCAPYTISAINNRGLTFNAVTFITGSPGGVIWLDTFNGAGDPADQAIVSNNHFIFAEIQVPMIKQQFGVFTGNTVSCFDNGTTTNYYMGLFSGTNVDNNTIVCDNSSSTAKTGGYVFQSQSNSYGVLNILGKNSVFIVKDNLVSGSTDGSVFSVPFGAPVTAPGYMANGYASNYSTPNTSVLDSAYNSARIWGIGPNAATPGGVILSGQAPGGASTNYLTCVSTLGCVFGVPVTAPGGTLTGALTGTSASFSGNVVAGSETLGSPLLPASGGTGATTAAGANLNITGVTQTGTLGTSSQVSTFPGTGTFSTVAAKTSVSFGATNTSADTTTIRNAVAASPTTQPSVNPFYLPPQTPLYLFDSTLSDGQIAAITTPLPINGQNGLLQFNVASGMDGFLINPGTYSSGLGGDGYYYQNVTNQNQTFVEASAPNTWLPGGANVRYWLRFDASNQGGFMNRWINNRFFGTTSGYSFFMNNATSGGVAPNQSAQNSNGGLFVSTIADNFMSAGIYMRNAGDTNLIRHNHINAPHGIYYSEISGAVDTLFEHNSVTSGDCPILYAGGYGASFIYNELGISQYFSQGCTTGTLTVGDGTSAVGNALVMGNTLGVDQVPTVPVSPLYIGATSTNVSVEWNMFEPPASTGNALIYNAGTLTRPGRNNWISGSKSPVVSQIVGPGTTAWENNKSIEGAAPVGVLENRLTCSEDLTCLSWVPANLGAGSLPAPTNVSGVATPNDPQNTSTVSCLVLALNGGTTTGDSSSITQSLTGLTNPHPVVGSAWLKSNVHVTGASVSGSGTGATITYTLSEIASCGGLTTAGAVSGKPYTVANVNPSSCNATAATVTATGTNTVTVAAPNTTCSYVSGGNVVFKIDVADGANGEEYDIGWANPNYPDNGWIRPSVSTPPSTAATTDLLRFVIVGSTVSTYSDSVDLLFGGADNASGLYPHIETTSTGPQPLQYGVMANGVKGAIPWAPSSTTPQNQLLYSGDLTNGAWVPSHSGLGSNPVVTTSAVLDPNGYATQQVAFNLNGDLTNTAYSELIQTVSGATNPHMAYERVCIKPTAATAIGGGSITNPVVFLGVVGYGNAQVTLTVGSWSCFNFTTSVAATSTQWVLFTAKPAAIGTDTMTALVSESQLSYKSIGISSYAQTTTAAIDYTSATAIYALNGDVTAQGNASTPVLATVKAINGAAVPTSKTVVGTNSNGQLVDASGATLTNNTSGTAASLLGTGGMWKPVAKVASSLYSGTTSTGLTTIYTPGSAGEFLLCGDMRITVAPSAQTQAEVYRSYTTDGHTDAGAVNTGANGQVVANLGTTTTQWAGAKACEPFWSDAAAIQVELFLSGVTGTPTYRWSATLYQMQ